MHETSLTYHWFAEAIFLHVSQLTASKLKMKTEQSGEKMYTVFHGCLRKLCKLKPNATLPTGLKLFCF